MMHVCLFKRQAVMGVRGKKSPPEICKYSTQKKYAAGFLRASTSAGLQISPTAALLECSYTQVADAVEMTL
jgi:hypothetical protein